MDQELQLADYNLSEDDSYHFPAYSPTRQLVMQVAPPGLTRLLISELINPTLNDELIEPLPPMPITNDELAVEDAHEESVPDVGEPLKDNLQETESILSSPAWSRPSSFSIPMAELPSVKRPLTSSDTESNDMPVVTHSKKVKVIYKGSSDSSIADIKDHKLVSKVVKTLKRSREPEEESRGVKKPAGWWKKFRKKE